MRDYLIQVDVLEAVQDFYPGLSVEDATQIADSILNKWDFNVQAWLADHPLGVTKLQHNRLLGLMHPKQG